MSSNFLKEIEMRSYLSFLFAIIVSGCGGGGGDGDKGANDVLQAYVSELSYPKPTTVVRAWDSQTYVVKPVVKYLKTNSEYVFSMVGSSTVVSVDKTTGNVTFSPNYPGGTGCPLVKLKWPKTGESLYSEVCLDKEYLAFSFGLSKVGSNNLTSENGQLVYTISKADPAIMSLGVGLSYFDRAKNESVFGGGIFPDESITTCSILKSDLPFTATVKRTGSTSTGISNHLDVNWNTASTGEYQFDVQCTISVGQESASNTAGIKVKLVN